MSKKKNLQKRRKLYLKLVLFCLLFFILYPAINLFAAQNSADKIVQIRANLLIPKKVGFAMAGESFDPKVIDIEFIRPVKKISLLARNNFKLSDIIVSKTSQGEIKGVFTFNDEYQRKIVQNFSIRYKQSGSGHYKVIKTASKQLEPLSPEIEIYFIPADKISRNQIKQMDMIQLLKFARKNSDKVTAAGKNAPVKSYEVLAFGMDRLGLEAKLTLHSDGQVSESWDMNGWHVVHMTSQFAVNSDQVKLFYVNHIRGKGPVEPGKAVFVGVFSNKYMPPVPPGPNLNRAIPQTIKDIKAKFDSKVFKN